MNYQELYNLIDANVIKTTITIVQALPDSIKDTVFDLFNQHNDGSDETKHVASVIRSVLHVESDHLARIITPLLQVTCIVAELGNMRDKDDGKGDLRGTLDQNVIMETMVVKSSKYVARIHQELMALPRDIKEACLSQLPEDVRKAAVPVLELTEGMAERDVEELFVTMAKEAFPEKEKPESNPVEVVMSIQNDYETTVGDPEKKKKFEKQVRLRTAVRAAAVSAAAAPAPYSLLQVFIAFYRALEPA
jgi:hypothetical protein